MLIVSVDIGTRNFAYTVYCTDKRSFVVFQILDLRKVKDPVLRMKELSDSEYFDKAEVILVENQMRSCMKTMATALRCFHLDKGVKVHPHSVKRFFQTSKKKHHKNKKAGIEEARKHLKGNTLVRFEKLKKKDDIADCILQTIWYMSTRSS